MPGKSRPDWLVPSITIEELLERIPAAARILSKFRIVCIACGEPVWGTLEENARQAGVTDLDPVLDALAAAVGEDA